MDPIDSGGTERDGEMEIDLNDGHSVIAQILVNLTEVKRDLHHLMKMAETHTAERSKLGERVGAVERAIPDKLEERLCKLETRSAQIALIGGLLVLLWPMIWGEISTRRAETAPQPAGVVAPARHAP